MALIILFLILSLFSCNDPFNEDSTMLIDLKPPQLQNVTLKSSRELTVYFDENVSFSKDSYFSEPDLPVESWETGEKFLTLQFSETQVPGKMYKCRCDVEDEKGNRLSFLIRYYGWNNRIPSLLINEFNPQCSGNNPDTIELYAKDSGNTAGMTLFLGTSRYFSDYLVLPSLEVVAGDFIIVHLRPEGIDAEINESSEKDESGGLLSSDLAWDIWAKKDSPLSGSNGIITLYTNPFGTIVDAVPYSERVTADSEDYRGWTSATFKMVEHLSFLNVWKTTEGFIRPEDAASSEGTTGTRSICRDSQSTDSNTPEDWHIVPTGEKSFGEANSDHVY